MGDLGHEDLVIRRGTIVDGSGRQPFVGDVAVTGKTISAVGVDLPVKGRREIDATGLVVAPGWIDCHTHFDGQVTWDPYLSPSSGGGVTTCVLGNCGVGFAPCQRERRGELIELVEAIEDIPGTALHEGMQWEWETFEEYMDALGRKELACDVAVMIGHGPLRNWVLGLNMSASDRPGGRDSAPVLPEQVEAMAAVVRDAVAKGAIGFSTSRAIYHRDVHGVLMPGTLASSAEMLALLRAIGEGGGGTFAANMDFRTYDDHLAGNQAWDEQRSQDHTEHEWGWLEQIARESRGKINMTFEAAEFAPERVDRAEDLMRRYEDTGFCIRTQCFARPQGFLQCVHSRMNLLQLSTTFRGMQRRCWGEAAGLSAAGFDERVAALVEQLRAPATRAQILGEAQSRFDRVKAAIKAGRDDPYKGFVSSICPFSAVFEWSQSYEPPPSESVRAIAERRGCTPLEVYYDILVPPSQEGGFGVAWKALGPYAQGQGFGDHERARRVIERPVTILGGSDAGAHCGIFQDAQSPTHLLTHWVRDRARGARLPIELVVSKQTKEVARLFHLGDRGELAPGKKADINVIDLEGLRMQRPYIVNDLPTGAMRWLQQVSGYRHTFVSGKETFADGKATGALPGCLVRNPKADASAWQGAAERLAWRSSAVQADSVDFSAQALRGAEGGGMSSIARIARALEGGQGDDSAGPGRSRL